MHEYMNNVLYHVCRSVLPTISLLRSHSKTDERESFGELLKRKAASGVSVVFLLWDDFGSSIWRNGFMSTYDAITVEYFSNSNVKVVLSRRDNANEEFLAQTIYKTTFTHHQKSIICDIRFDESDRRTVGAFIGGLDLTGN